MHIYIIVNNKLNGAFHLVTPKAIPIATQSFSMNLRSAMGSSLDLSYVYAKTHGIDFNVSHIAHILRNIVQQHSGSPARATKGR
jgi:hypothetical protein